MADVDIEVIRAFSDRVAASYEAAQAYAYCPSSEPYRNHMQKARAAKLHLDAVLDAAGVAPAAPTFNKFGHIEKPTDPNPYAAPGVLASDETKGGK